MDQVLPICPYIVEHISMDILAFWAPAAAARCQRQHKYHNDSMEIDREKRNEKDRKRATNRSLQHELLCKGTFDAILIHLKCHFVTLQMVSLSDQIYRLSIGEHSTYLCVCIGEKHQAI